MTQYYVCRVGQQHTSTVYLAIRLDVSSIRVQPTLLLGLMSAVDVLDMDDADFLRDAEDALSDAEEDSSMDVRPWSALLSARLCSAAAAAAAAASWQASFCSKVISHNTPCVILLCTNI